MLSVATPGWFFSTNYRNQSQQNPLRATDLLVEVFIEQEICVVNADFPQLDHLNKQHKAIKVTTEIMKDKKLAYLDSLAKVKEDNSTKFTVYRKPTHTDQYLDFRSNHHINQKI